MCSSVVLSMFTLLHHRSPALLHLVIKVCTHSTTTPDFLLLPTPGNRHSMFCFYEFTLDTSYTRNHSVFAFSWLVYFTEHNVSEVHLCYSVHQNFLPFYGSAAFHCTGLAHFVSPSIHWWTLGLFPSLVYCELGCCEDGRAREENLFLYSLKSSPWGLWLNWLKTD